MFLFSLVGGKANLFKITEHAKRRGRGIIGFVSHRRQREVDFFFILERFDAIRFVTSSHRRPTRAFTVRYEEQKRAKKGNIRLSVAVRGSRTPVLKLSIERVLVFPQTVWEEYT